MTAASTGAMKLSLLGEQGTAEMLFYALECVAALVDGSWLLSRTSCQATMPFADEWEEAVHVQAREALFEALGLVCVALRHMEGSCPSEFKRFDRALLLILDEALRAVLSGWDDHLLMMPSCDSLSGGAGGVAGGRVLLERELPGGAAVAGGCDCWQAPALSAWSCWACGEALVHCVFDERDAAAHREGR